MAFQPNYQASCIRHRFLGIVVEYISSMGFPGGSMGKNLPAKLETWIGSLGWEGLLEKEMATHSSVPAWAGPSTEKPGGL